VSKAAAGETMVSNAKTRNRPANGGAQQVSPIDFSVEFSIPDPTDINSMKSKIVFPDEDDTEIDDEEEVDFGTRVLRYRKGELLRELQQIKKLEQEAQNGQDDGFEDEDEDDDDEFDRRRLPLRRSH
jgi:hypothetical protein